MATAYNAITDATIDPDSPITTQLATRWRDNPLAQGEQSTGAPTLPSTRIYYCEEQQNSGTDSSTSPTSATWVPRRDLVEIVDTLEADGTAAGSISGANDDTINLPLGTYWMHGTCIIGYDHNAGAGTIQDVIAAMRLRNTTDGSTEVQGPSLGGVGLPIDSNDEGHMEVMLMGYFQITGAKALQLQVNQTGIINTSGGVATSYGTEVYARAAFWRLDLTGT